MLRPYEQKSEIAARAKTQPSPFAPQVNMSGYATEETRRCGELSHGGGR